MDFDGAINKEGARACIWIIPLNDNNVKRFYSFKLDIQCTNNVVEYEDFILGLNILKILK